METEIFKPNAYNTRSDYRQLKELQAGFKILYRCQRGYNLIIDEHTQPEVSCLETGQWSKPNFRCESISCGPPPSITNGYLRREEFNNIHAVGSRAIVSCDHSFVATRTEIYCGPDGQWNVDDSICQRANLLNRIGSDCGPPPTISNGFLSINHYDSKYPQNSMAIVYCEQTYTSKITEVFCRTDGRWDVPPNICQNPYSMGCGHVPEVPNGYINIYPSEVLYPIGAKAPIICNDGFNPAINFATCEGIWNVSQTVCQRSEPRCGPAPLIDNGIVNPPAGMETYPVGTHANIICNQGFYSDSYTATCEEQGVWNLKEVDCHKRVKHCGAPPLSSNVVVLNEQQERQLYPLGYFINYGCNEKHFIISGSTTNACTLNGWLQKISPNCTEPNANECDPVPPLQNGNLKVSSSGPVRPVELSVKVECSPGYRAKKEFLACDKKGKWNINEIKCERDHTTDCTAPEGIENGFIDKLKSSKQATYPLEYKVIYRCPKDYTLVGEATRICTDGGWSGEVPVCKVRFCSAPKFKGRRDSLNQRFLVGYIFERVCPPGKAVLEGNSKIECLEGGVWSNELPECESYNKTECPLVPFSNERGLFAPSDESTIKMVCPDGTIPLNSNVTSSTCDDRTGRWIIPEDMGCVPFKKNKSCIYPDGVENGVISALKQDAEYREGDQLFLICNKGYTISLGVDHITCLNNGYWDKSFGACLAATCDLPSKARNGELEPKLSDDVQPYGQIFNARCDYGYRLTGNSIMRCTETGWDNTVPSCRKITCRNPGTPENGWYHGSSFNFRERVTFGCFSGYKLYGSKERICMENGKWSGQLTVCDSNKQDCPDPGTPLHGIKTGSIYNEGDVVSYSCESGYTLLGSRVRSCNQRQWTGREPQCIGKNDFDDASDVSQNLKSLVSKVKQVMNSNGRPAQEQNANKPNDALRAKEKDGASLRETLLVICYLFDSSSSIGQLNFQKSINLAKAISKNVGIFKNGPKTCAITFDTTAHLKIVPTTFNSVDAVSTALDALPYEGGRGTSLESAFKVLGEKVLNTTSKANPDKDISFVTFLFTDGKVKQSSELRKYMRNLRSAFKLTVLSIALTGYPNKDILFAITSSYRNRKRTFLLDSYSTMDRITKELLGNNEIDYSVCGKEFDHSTVLVDFSPSNETEDIDNTSYQLWPWTVQIYYVKDKKSYTARCLGSLISNDMVLTSSLCFEKNMDPRKIFTKSGVDKFHVSYAEKLIEVRSASAATKATIIKLQNPVKFSQYTRPVCLPGKEIDMRNNSSSSIGYTSSWSKSIRGGRYGDIAKVHFKIQSTDECRGSARELGAVREIGRNLFCAGNAGTILDVCGPDLGSPLFQYHFDKSNQPQWVQTGIAVAFTRRQKDQVENECYNPSPLYNIFLNLTPLSSSIHDIIRDA